MDIRVSIGIMIFAMLIAGCAAQLTQTGKNARYDCGTYSDGVLVTLPVAPLNAEVGEVTIIFHGEKMKAAYLRNGLKQFWYLTDSIYIELEPTMNAFYWDYTGADEGETRNAKR